MNHRGRLCFGRSGFKSNHKTRLEEDKEFGWMDDKGGSVDEEV